MSTDSNININSSASPLFNIQFDYTQPGSRSWVHEPGTNNDWPTVPRVPPSVINNFFNQARTELRGLRDFFAQVTTNEQLRIYRGQPRDNANSNEWTTFPPYIGPPENWERFDTFIFDLTVNNGVVDVPIINFPPGFTGSYVLNVPISGDVRFSCNAPTFGDESSQYGSYGDVIYANDYSHRIIWNFTGNSRIIPENNANPPTPITIVGSILAPDIDFYAPQGGNIKGFLIVNNLTHDSQGFEMHTPTPPNPPIPPTFIRPPIDPPDVNGGTNGGGTNGGGTNGGGTNGSNGAISPPPPTVTLPPGGNGAISPPPPTVDPPEEPEYPEYPEEPEYPEYPEYPEEPEYPEYPNIPPNPSTEIPQEPIRVREQRWSGTYYYYVYTYVDPQELTSEELYDVLAGWPINRIPEGEGSEVLGGMPTRLNPQTGSEQSFNFIIFHLFAAIASLIIIWFLQMNIIRRKRSYRAYLTREKRLKELLE